MFYLTSKRVIGFVSLSNPMTDQGAWSGTLFYLWRAIEKAGFDVIWIPIGTQLSDKLLSLLVRIWNHLFPKNKWLTGLFFRPLAKLRAKELKASPIVKGCDLLFFPGGGQMAPYARINKPYIYLSDATVGIMIDYYWFGINKKSRKMAVELDAAACRGALINIRSSQWAIDSVINDYKCDSNKCFVLEFGANIDDKYVVGVKPYIEGQLRILFSGVDWERKGADIAVETVRKLISDGYDAKLYLAGIEVEKIPSEYRNLGFVDYLGYLDKSIPEQHEKYIAAIRNCHCLLLPSRAECSSIAICEASAFGLPTFTYDTGGLANYVINRVTGYRLPMNATSADFAERITEVIKKNEFRKLFIGSRSLYMNKTSWKAWSRRFPELIEKHLNRMDDLENSNVNIPSERTLAYGA